MSRHKYFKDFKAWITTQTPLAVVAQYAHVSIKSLQRHFKRFFKQPPKPQRSKRKQKIWLKVDATYFSKWGCVIVYKAGGKILYWQYAEYERYDVYATGLKWLMHAGYEIEGVTSDWHGSIVAAVKYLLPDVPHQRCLVHTQRLCQSLLTQRPKTKAGQMLLSIVYELNHITNKYEKNIWLKWFLLWRRRYEDLSKERTYSTTDEGKSTWWYTHKNLRRVFRTLMTTQDHLFLYLNHTGLDKDTNGLEAEFKHLKEKIGAHSGLRKVKRISYIAWYLYFKNQ